MSSLSEIRKLAELSKFEAEQVRSAQASFARAEQVRRAQAYLKTGQHPTLRSERDLVAWGGSDAEVELARIRAEAEEVQLLLRQNDAQKRRLVKDAKTLQLDEHNQETDQKEMQHSGRQQVTERPETARRRRRQTDQKVYAGAREIGTASEAANDIVQSSIEAAVAANKFYGDAIDKKTELDRRNLLQKLATLESEGQRLFEEAEDVLSDPLEELNPFSDRYRRYLWCNTALNVYLTELEHYPKVYQWAIGVQSWLKRSEGVHAPALRSFELEEELLWVSWESLRIHRERHQDEGPVQIRDLLPKIEERLLKIRAGMQRLYVDLNIIT